MNGTKVRNTVAGERRELSVPSATRRVKVSLKAGLHLRVCLAIVTAAGRHRAKVLVQNGNQSADAASIFELLSLAASPGTELTLVARGPEAKEAVRAVAELCTDDSEDHE